MSTPDAAIETCGEQSTLRLAGDVDLAVAEDVAALAAAALSRSGVRRLVIDMSNVTYLDSSGVGALVRTHNLADERGITVILRGASVKIIRIFEITGLADRFGLSPQGRHSGPDTAAIAQ